MTYFEGFVVAVPEASKDEYVKHARKMAPALKECGVGRMVECWGDDVPRGTVTDFYRAVEAKEGEAIVFSFFEYPSKNERDAANGKLMSDPRLADMGASAPFDAKRMIYGGFDSLLDVGSGGGSYLNGLIAPVSRAKKDQYRAMAEQQAGIFREYGALRLVQAWGDDVPQGKITDFYRAVQATGDETVVFSFIEWPSKQTSSEAWDKIMKDERMKPSGEVPFDGKRMFYGSFEKLLDTGSAEHLEAQVQIGQPA
jgi:uncharacterized protein YbaA (DUF1428 family)